jgi:hypothetical protein
MEGEEIGAQSDYVAVKTIQVSSNLLHQMELCRSSRQLPIKILSERKQVSKWFVGTHEESV